ncbi:hypothetical protein RFI_19753, partial [Reticulomyxa filosa]
MQSDFEDEESEQVTLEPKVDESECYHVKCVSSGRYWECKEIENGRIMIYTQKHLPTSCFFISQLPSGHFRFIWKDDHRRQSHEKEKSIKTHGDSEIVLYYRLCYALDHYQPFMLRVKYSDLFLGVRNASVKNMAPIIQDCYNGKKNKTKMLSLLFHLCFYLCVIMYTCVKKSERKKGDKRYCVILFFYFRYTYTLFFFFFFFQKGGENQQFYFEKAENGYYFVRCASSQKYWDIDEASVANGAPLIQVYICIYIYSFIIYLLIYVLCFFYYIYIYIFIYTYINNKIMTQLPAAIEQISEVQTYVCVYVYVRVQYKLNKAENQQFRVEPCSGPWCRIIARHSELVLNVDNTNMAKAARVQQWTSTWRGNQEFELVVMKEQQMQHNITLDGPYYIRAVHSKKFFQSFEIFFFFFFFGCMFYICMYVYKISGESKSDDAAVLQWKFEGCDQQQFCFEQATEENEYYIKCVHSGKYLDLSCKSIENGTPILQRGLHKVFISLKKKKKK